MEVEVVSSKEDAEALWIASRQALRTPAPEEVEHRDAATKQADLDKNSRTNVVLAWIVTNMLMIIVCECYRARVRSLLVLIVFIYIVTSDFFTTWASEHFDNAGGGMCSYFTPLLCCDINA